MPDPHVMCLAAMSFPSAWGLVAMSGPGTWVWQSCHASTSAANLRRLGGAAIQKEQKHPYMQPCFCWNPRVISYLNYLNKIKRWWSPSTQTYIFPSIWGMNVSSLFIFLEKKKDAPNLKVKILYPEGLINIYTVGPQSFFQCQMYIIKKTISPLTACLASFFGKNNYIITLLQSTVVCVLVNSKRVNSEILISFSILYNKRQIMVFLASTYRYC